jgi:hypothetical protein
VIWGRGGGRTNRRPSGFPNNKAKTALKLPWFSLLRRGFGVIEESGKPLPEVTPNSSKYRGHRIRPRYLLRRPFKKIELVGNERKGLRTNFPKWREPQTKLYFIYNFTRTILLLKYF